MEHIESINSCQSALPANIDKIVALEIKQSCGVTDAFQILDNYPNIKYIKVAGQNYTSQEVKQMGIGEQLGSERNAIDRAVVVDPPWQPAIGLDPAPVQDIYEQLRNVPASNEPVNFQALRDQMRAIQDERQRNQIPYYQQLQVQGESFYTDDTYRRYMEQLMQDSPEYRQFGDVSRPATATELINQNTIRGTTADMVWYDEVPISSMDGYWNDQAPAM